LGYTQYWRRPLEIPQKKFEAIASDFKRVVDACQEAGIRVRDGHGENEPILNADLISFNGDASCGHTERDLGITWPSSEASGAAEDGEVAGEWSAGASLATRTCGGDCSHETCYFPRVYKPDSWDEPKKGLYFGFCKTAYKPYDIAVTAFLLICKHHLKSRIVVSSDGEDKDWFDAKMLCDKLFGYGLGYTLDEKGEISWIKSVSTSGIF
jgi:hypothetical protein